MCETPLSPTVRAGFPSGELISCVQSESGPSSRNGAKDDKQDVEVGGGIPLTHCIIILMENNQDEKPQSL